MPYTFIKNLSDDTILASDSEREVVLQKIGADDIPMFRKLIKVDNPNVVKFLDVTEVDGNFYAVEEYVEGNNLQQMMDNGHRFTEDEVMNIALQLCNGLEDVHELGIVHRDITPNNVIICTDRNVKIIDFNISRLNKSGKKTDTEILGTPGFAAPEQFGFSQTNSRADIYSLGVLMNYLLTGGRFPTEVIYSGSLKHIIERCTKISEEQRYRNIRELEDDIQQTFRLKFGSNDVSPKTKSYKKLYISIIAVLLAALIGLSACIVNFSIRLNRLESGTTTAATATTETVDSTEDVDTAIDTIAADDTDTDAADSTETTAKAEYEVSDVHILPFTYPYEDSEANYEIYFTVTNTGSTNLKLGYGDVNFTDKNDNFVYSVTMMDAAPDIIAPGETAYYSTDYLGDLPDEFNENCIGTAHFDANSTDEKIIRLDAENVKIRDQEVGGIQITGTAKNNSDRDIDDAWIYVALFDNDGNFITGCKSVTTSGTVVGESCGFNMEIDHNITADQVKSYKVFAFET